MIKAMMNKPTTTVTRHRPPIRHLPAILVGLAAGAGFADQQAQPLSAQAAYGLPQPAPDAIIAYAEHPRRFGEPRMPGGNGPFGVAVIIHGGGWLAARPKLAESSPLFSPDPQPVDGVVSSIPAPPRGQLAQRLQRQRLTSR